jgi:hypothetical protein
MTDLMMKVYRKWAGQGIRKRWGGWIVPAVFLACLSLAWSQDPRTVAAAAQTPTSPPPQQDQKPAGEGARPKQPDSASEPATKISPQDAEELFREVDEILKFSSKDSGLPIKREVKRRLTNRDEVVAYLEKNMREDKSAQRVQRSELVLKKFGLLPHDFKLGPFLVGLLREQIAGYYDAKTKTMNLLDWVPVGQQRAVLAHELTHALQDQSFNLEKWMKDGGDIDKKKQITPADILADEADETKQAIVEGQAEAVMLEYALNGTGRSLVSSPEIVAALNHDMMDGTPDSVQFRNAPIFLKESLTFPYRYGVEFVIAMLQSGGKQKAFEMAFADPPHVTRQIMEPRTYLSGERIEPIPMPDFRQLFKNYDRFDVGAIGEFDSYMLIEQYAGLGLAKTLSPSWRGGYYYSVKSKTNPTAPLGLLYVSRWSDPERASQFGAIYAKSLAHRYHEVHATDATGPGTFDRDKLEGRNIWSTEEGTVVIEVKGDEVLVAESMDDTTNRQVEDAVFALLAGK